MKKYFFIFLFAMLTGVASAQPVIDLGPKVGLTRADLSLDVESYNTETIMRYHFGAFGRVGYGRLFVQPEIYWNSRSNDFSEIMPGNPLDVLRFDYSTVDVPLLAGLKLIKGNFIQLRAMGGPLFSFVTARDIAGTGLNPDNLRNNFFGWQYGVGADIWFLTFDIRMENSQTNIIEDPLFNARNQTFLISVGLKIL